MQITQTNIEGCFVIEPKIYKDNRGLFFETFNKRTFEKRTNKNIDFVQDNQSTSLKGVLRGLHFQKGDSAQAKLVSVIKGAVQDVAVDLRPDSKTFGEHVSIVLTAQNKHQLFIPRGFAHGFLVLEDDTVFSYKCDNFYDKNSESGIRFDDSDLNIEWKMSHTDIVLSEKDKRLPTFEKLFK